MRPGAVPHPATGRARSAAHGRAGVRHGLLGAAHKHRLLAAHKHRLLAAHKHRLLAAHGHRLLAALLLVGPALPLGCAAGTPPIGPVTTGSPVASQPTEPRAQLAALAAAAQDRHLVALYTLSVGGRPDRTVAVTTAADGSWRVDIPGGVLGGTADVSVAQNAAGLFQCSLPSTQRPDPSTCLRVADPGQRLPAGIDPRVQHPFTDWPDVLTDRRAPLSVSTSRLSGARGSCFAVESTSASVGPPLDPGIYCYDPDGTLTAARLASGTLILAGTPTAPPATIPLPGPVVDGEPLRVAAPPTAEHTAPGEDGSSDNPAGWATEPTG